jgi:uncharacterized protein (TIRG00374 family)
LVLAVLAAGAYGLLFFEQSSQILAPFKAFDFRWGLWAFACYGLNMLLKTWRFSYFLHGALPFSRMVAVVVLHSFWNNVLPYRTGELSYLYLLKKQGVLSRSQNIMSLLCARIFDALSLVTLVCLGFSLSSRATHPAALQAGAIVTMAVLVIISLAMLMIMISHPHWILEPLRRFSLGMNRGKSLLQKLHAKLVKAMDALAQLRPHGAFSAFFFLSLVIWLSDAAIMWSGLRAAGVTLNISSLFWISAFPVLSALIPVQMPGGIGAFEAALTAGLLMAGIPLALAISTSIVLHAELLAFAALSGGGAFLYLRKTAQS